MATRMTLLPAHLSSTAWEQQHRFARLEEPVGSHGRGLDSTKALKDSPCRQQPVARVRQTTNLQPDTPFPALHKVC